MLSRLAIDLTPCKSLAKVFLWSICIPLPVCCLTNLSAFFLSDTLGVVTFLASSLLAISLSLEAWVAKPNLLTLLSPLRALFLNCCSLPSMYVLVITPALLGLPSEVNLLLALILSLRNWENSVTT